MEDVVIIGGGISGGSAALYTSKGNLKTTVIDAGHSQINKVSTIFNYPGIHEISGEELIVTIEQQARDFGTEWIYDEVIAVSQEDDVFIVETKSGHVYKSKYVIIATNLQVDLFSPLGIELTVNEKVPSGKIKKVIDLSSDGQTEIENLFVTGLLAGLPSQSVIAASHGVQVAIEIVSRETEKTYMWHDV